ncbi:MAG: hypothetical protein II596_00605, partial [Thermoguttaceae bacterium]|nr:hypothetical protein [Thermoguttaceae bacterium]
VLRFALCKVKKFGESSFKFLKELFLFSCFGERVFFRGCGSRSSFLEQICINFVIFIMILAIAPIITIEAL